MLSPKGENRARNNLQFIKFTLKDMKSVNYNDLLQGIMDKIAIQIEEYYVIHSFEIAKKK